MLEKHKYIKIKTISSKKTTLKAKKGEKEKGE